MIWILQREEYTIPETCSPSTLFHYFNSGSFLDIDRFPIKQEIIDEMPNFFHRVNKILQAWNVTPISLKDIINIQRIAWILAKDKLIDEFIELETHFKPLALWLFVYLEIRIPIQHFDPKWQNAFHDNAMNVLDN